MTDKSKTKQTSEEKKQSISRAMDREVVFCWE